MFPWMTNWWKGGAAAAAERASRTLAARAWPADLLAVLDRLREGGHRAYLVGGTVRDALLRRPEGPTADVATDLVPEAVTARFRRVEPTGLQHGTVLILDGALPVECTTFRRESGYSDARRPDRVEYTLDPLEDLDRRDLTVNALAFDPDSGELLDPHGGSHDLERRILRAVGDPLARFREDALRPLRVARLAAVLEMDPDEPLREGMRAVADPATGVRAQAVSPERILAELQRMLRAPSPSVGLELLRESGLLGLWLPELARCVGVPQNRFHAYDVYRHSILTCDAAPREKPVVRWAALLHDIGKPDTRAEKDGEGTFHGHQEVGAELADRLLLRLRMPTAEREAIVHLVREHMFDYRPEWSDAAVRRWLRRVGTDRVADLFDLRIADALGNGRHRGFPSYLETMRERVTGLMEAALALDIADLAVDGHDVMRELGIAPGPRVREVLESLLEEVLDRPEKNIRQILLDRLRSKRASDAARS